MKTYRGVDVDIATFKYLKITVINIKEFQDEIWRKMNLEACQIIHFRTCYHPTQFSEYHDMRTVILFATWHDGSY
jgi:hypothetical protein